MVMYDDEFQIKENTIKGKPRIKLNHNIIQFITTGIIKKKMKQLH